MVLTSTLECFINTPYTTYLADAELMLQFVLICQMIFWIVDFSYYGAYA